MNKTKYLFLLEKVENGKYPEAETWHPESIDRRSYYRLCKNFWWPFRTWGQFRPNLGAQLFYLILQELCHFSETWDLRYLIFLRMLFLQKFWFLGIFLVFPQYWATKWIKIVNFQCVPFEPNFKIFKDFSNNAFVLLD